MLEFDPSDSVLESPPQSGRLPVVTVQRAMLFPQLVQTLQVRDPQRRELLHKIADANAHVIVVPEMTRECPASKPLIGCLGRIAIHQSFADGRSMFVLRGVCRVVICETDPPEEQGATLSSYEVVPDQYPDTPAIDRSHRRQELLELFFRRYPRVAENPLVSSLLEEEMPFGALCDLLALSIRLRPNESQRILSATNVDERSDFVLEQLKATARLVADGAFEFPPAFSWN